MMRRGEMGGHYTRARMHVMKGAAQCSVQTLMTRIDAVVGLNGDLEFGLSRVFVRNIGIEVIYLDLMGVRGISGKLVLIVSFYFRMV